MPGAEPAGGPKVPPTGDDVSCRRTAARVDAGGMAEIIVGVDGSPNSLAALRWAHREAALRGDDVVALFAWGFVPPGHAPGGHTLTPATAPRTRTLPGGRRR
jgi:hypothetical protein